MKNNFKLNKNAIKRIEVSNLPQSMKNAFPALFGMSVNTNSTKTTTRLIWHDKDTKNDEFVPFLVVGVMKLSRMKEEEAKGKAKMKRNPKKHYQFSLPRQK